MGIMLKRLHELQVNGETVGEDDDFNMNDDTGAEAEPAEAPADTANNAAEENAENDVVEDDEEDDFVIDDDTEEDLDNTEDAAEEGEQDENENADQPNDAEDTDDDFTVDGNDDAEAGGENETTDEGNDNGGNAEEAAPQNPTDAVSDSDNRAAEEEIYSSLTDDQKRIRVLQLKIDYKDLYETFINSLEGINGIPINTDNLETIKRLITLLTKAKAILIDYIANNFDSNTYLENYTNYLKYLAIFRTASKVIEELNASKK